MIYIINKEDENSNTCQRCPMQTSSSLSSLQSQDWATPFQLWVISPSLKDVLPITHKTTKTMIMMLGMSKYISVPNIITVVREALVISQHVLPTDGRTKSPRKQSKRPLRPQEKQISTSQQYRLFWPTISNLLWGTTLIASWRILKINNV